ncbi:hypothetical protein PC116_g25712 [Phytophthora cactorum]|nr:hypothetical protein PC116_g25712 [Phytophthora cactorum]
MESSFSDAKMRVGPDGVYMEIFANKVLPFDVSSTVLCHFYQKDQQVRFMLFVACSKAELDSRVFALTNVL